MEDPADLPSQVDSVIEAELQCAVVEPLRDHVYGVLTTSLRKFADRCELAADHHTNSRHRKQELQLLRRGFKALANCSPTDIGVDGEV